MAINYTINIEVDPPNLVPAGGSTGNFVYTPALLRVKHNDKVTWKCSSPFVLVFKDGTPVDEVQLVGAELSGIYTTGAHEIRDVRGQFHYAVAVFQSDRVFMDSSCAVLSVN